MGLRDHSTTRPLGILQDGDRFPQDAYLTCSKLVVLQMWNIEVGRGLPDRFECLSTNGSNCLLYTYFGFRYLTVPRSRYGGWVVGGGFYVRD